MVQTTVIAIVNYDRKTFIVQAKHLCKTCCSTVQAMLTLTPWVGATAVGNDPF
jgi:hypothetical protein